MSTPYGTAHDAGKVITETPHKSLNAKAEKLAQSIIDRLGALTLAKEVA